MGSGYELDPTNNFCFDPDLQDRCTAIKLFTVPILDYQTLQISELALRYSRPTEWTNNICCKNISIYNIDVYD